MSNSPEAVVKMIMDFYDSNDKVGTMGSVMYELATRVEDTGTSDEDRLLMKKMSLLKKAEFEHNLAWMDYKSWYACGFDLRETFDNLVDPLHWNGIFFEYSSFEEYHKEILRYLGTCVVNVVEFDSYKRLYCMNAESRDYNWIKNKEFDYISVQIRNGLILSFGIEHGQLVTKEHQKKKNADSTT